MARSLERIDPVLNLLAIIWKKFPDMRFGQLITNIFDADIDNNFYQKEVDEICKDILNYVMFFDKKFSEEEKLMIKRFYKKVEKLSIQS